MTEFLDQRAAVAGGAVKLDGCMGDVEFMCQLVFDPVEQTLAIPVIVRLNLHMRRQGEDM